jgi:hypothetical protein
MRLGNLDLEVLPVDKEDATAGEDIANIFNTSGIIA